MVTTIMLVLHLSATCPHAVVKAAPGQSLGAVDIRQAEKGATRCAEKYKNSPCLGTLLKTKPTSWQTTCVATLNEEKTTDDKEKVDPRTTDPRCKSCHVPKHPKPSTDEDNNGTPGQVPDYRWPYYIRDYILSK